MIGQLSRVAWPNIQTTTARRGHVAGALTTWRIHTHEQHRLRNTAGVIVRRLANRSLAKSWDSWAARVNYRRRKTAALEHGALQRLSRAWKVRLYDCEYSCGWGIRLSETAVVAHWGFSTVLPPGQVDCWGCCCGAMCPRAFLVALRCTSSLSHVNLPCTAR